jgi:hypothetical protein
VRTGYIAKYERLASSSVISERISGVRGLGAIQSKASVECLLRVSAKETNSVILDEIRVELETQLQLGLYYTSTDLSFEQTTNRLAVIKSRYKAKGYEGFILAQWKHASKISPEGEKMFAATLVDRFDPVLCSVWSDILRTSSLEFVKNQASDCLQSWGGWEIQDVERARVSGANLKNLEYGVTSLAERYRKILSSKRLIDLSSDNKAVLLWISHSCNDMVARDIAFRLLTSEL